MPRTADKTGNRALRATETVKANSYLAALTDEARGYELRIEVANDNGDKLTAAKYAKRLKAVHAEAARVSENLEVTPFDPNAEPLDNGTV